MKKRKNIILFYPKIICLALLTLTFSDSIFAQWREITNLPAIQKLYCIDAIGDQFAAIGAYPGQILITTDGGNSWDVKLLSSSYCPIDISVVDRNTIYVALDNGTFIKTIDGGNNWAEAYSNSQKTGFANYIEMFSAAEGIAMGDGNFLTKIPVFLKTNNGINWIETCNQSLGGGASDGWLGIDFVNPSVGYYSPKGGPYPRKLCKTTDGGYTWKETDFDIYADVLKFYTEDYGILVHVPNVYRTTNGGTSWDTFPILMPSEVPARDVEFVPNKPDQIWMSSYKGLFFSSDSGKTWIKWNTPNMADVLDIVFTNQETGWLISHNGQLFYTNNCGGIISSVAEKENIPFTFTLFQNYPNPFNPGTKIEYSLSKPSFVSLNIYNQLGQLIARLKNAYEPEGFHEVLFDASRFVSGVYYYTLTVDALKQTKQMVLMK